MFKRIRICNLLINTAIGIMKAAADFVRQQCSAYLIPIFMICLQIVFLAAWIIVIVYLFSSGTIKQLSEGSPFGWVGWNNTIQSYVIIYVFGLIW
jgi:hypothetical protein